MPCAVFPLITNDYNVQEKEKFKSRIKEFFEEDIKDKLIKLELKTFIGTSFQIISG